MTKPMYSIRKYLYFVLLAGLFTLISGCASVATLNLLVQDDPGAKRAAQNIAYGSNPRQQLDVYVPKAGADGADVVLFIYGGSWNKGNKKDYSFVGNNFAARGYVTVVMDYRLVPEVLYPDFLFDAGMALKWVEDNIATYGGNPDRIFVAGHSAGAYNAVMLAVAPDYALAAGADPKKIKGAIGISGPYDFYPFDFEVGKTTFGHVEDGATTQPINRMTADAPALLLVTGTKDTTVYPKNTKAMAAKARELGVPVTEIYYDGLDHAGPLMALGRPFKNKAPILENIDAFIASVK